MQEEGYNRINQDLSKLYNRNECDDDGGDLDSCEKDDLEDIQDWVQFTKDKAAFIMEGEQDPDDRPKRPSSKVRLLA